MRLRVIRLISITLIILLAVSAIPLWARQDLLRPEAYSERLAAIERIEAHIEGMSQAEFRRTAKRLVDEGMTYDAVLDEAFWSKLDDETQATIRAVTEREIKDAVRRACDGLYFIFFNALSNKPVGLWGPGEINATAAQMVYTGAVTGFEILTMPEDDAMDAMEEYARKFFRTYKASAHPERVVFSVLGRRLEINPSLNDEVDGLLARVHSNSVLSLTSILHPTFGYVPTFKFFKGHREGEICVVDRELATSPFNVLTVAGFNIGNNISAIRFPRIKDLLRTLYYESETGRRGHKFFIPDQSREGKAIRRWLLNYAGIKYPAEVNDESRCGPFFDANKLVIGRHEATHKRTLETLARAGYTSRESGGNNDTIFYAGIGLGNTMNELLSDFSSYMAIGGLARTDPYLATIAFHQELALMYDRYRDYDMDWADEAYFKIPVFVSCINADGTVDFEKFRKMTEQAFGLMMDKLKGYANAMQHEAFRGTTRTELFKERNMRSRDAVSFSRIHEGSVIHEFVAQLFPEYTRSVSSSTGMRQFVDVCTERVFGGRANVFAEGAPMVDARPLALTHQAFAAALSQL